MFDLIYPLPSAGAISAQPLSVAELDAHPDRDRIWATIQQVRAGVSDDLGGISEDYADDVESAFEEGKDEAITKMRSAFEEELSKSRFKDDARAEILVLFSASAFEAS